MERGILKHIDELSEMGGQLMSTKQTAMNCGKTEKYVCRNATKHEVRTCIHICNIYVPVF